jgi:hypothetical protein
MQCTQANVEEYENDSTKAPDPSAKDFPGTLRELASELVPPELRERVRN